MDILFQIHYEWNKELFCLYYQTQNRKYRRILLFFCGAVIIFSFCLCSKIGREMIMTMMILFVCAVILINKIQFLRSKICILIITLIDLYVIVFQHGVRFQLISLLILLIIYLLRHFMNEYNYEEIPTEAVKKGMVLSYMVIMQFTRSRVKGLPEETSEDMKSRITEEQAEAIRRWKDSKYGKETIIIVRKIPFAIFIFLGTVVFLTVRTIG